MKTKTQKKIKTRNKGIVEVRVGDLITHNKNYREHDDFQMSFLGNTIGKIGYYGYQDVFETEEGYVLIDGEARKKFLVAEYGEDAVIEVNLTDFEVDEANIAIATHDPIASFAHNNLKMQAELIREIEESDPNGLDEFFPDEYLEQILQKQFDDVDDNDEENDEQEDDNLLSSDMVKVKFTTDQYEKLTKKFKAKLRGPKLADRIVEAICGV